LFFTGVGKSMLFHLVPFPDIFPDYISTGTFDPGLSKDGLIFGDSLLKATKDFTFSDF
jgi:hypothetical protein